MQRPATPRQLACHQGSWLVQRCHQPQLLQMLQMLLRQLLKQLQPLCERQGTHVVQHVGPARAQRVHC